MKTTFFAVRLHIKIKNNKETTRMLMRISVLAETERAQLVGKNDEYTFSLA